MHKNSAIKAHMKSVHNMSISEYRQQFILNERIDEEMEEEEMEQEEERDEYEEGEVVLNREGEEVSNGEKEEEVEEVEGEGLDEIEIDEEEEIVLEGEGVVGEGGISGDGERRRWYEGCSYVCIPCNKEFIYLSIDDY